MAEIWGNREQMVEALADQYTQADAEERAALSRAVDEILLVRELLRGESEECRQLRLREIFKSGTEFSG